MRLSGARERVSCSRGFGDGIIFAKSESTSGIAVTVAFVRVHHTEGSD